MPRKASHTDQSASPPDASTAESTEHLGETLRRYRELGGFTQESLAKQAGISRTGLALIERGVERNVRLTTLELLANVLGLDIIDLLARPGAAPHGPCPQEFFIRAACNISRYRKRAGLSQEELSELAHRYRTFVPSLEQLHAMPNVVGLEALTKPLGVSVIDLLMPVSDDEYEERRARLPRSRRLKQEQKRAQKKLKTERTSG